MRLRLITTAALALLMAAPASAQVFGGRRQDEAIASLQTRVAELQEEARKAQAANTAIVEAHAATRTELTAATTKLGDLEATIRSMNSTLETLAAELTQSRRELAQAGRDTAAAQAQNRDFAERLARMEAQAQPTTPAVAAAPTRPAEPAAAFAEARRLMNAGNFAEAAAAFEAYTTDHAGQPNVAEANYWLGETLFAQEQHGDAAQAYIAALKGWPKSTWAPDAVVKLSNSLVALKQTTEACRALTELDRRYASAPAAVKDRARRTRTAAKCA